MTNWRERMVKVKDCEWTRASPLRKRVSGCFSYLLMALVALFAPVSADMEMYKVLREQFEDDGK